MTPQTEALVALLIGMYELLARVDTGSKDISDARVKLILAIERLRRG